MISDEEIDTFIGNAQLGTDSGEWTDIVTDALLDLKLARKLIREVLRTFFYSNPRWGNEVSASTDLLGALSDLKKYSNDSRGGET